MKKKILALALTAALAFGSVFSLTACGDDSSSGGNADGKASSITIAIPNDATNGGRALLLLESLGYIQVKDSAGITATVLDIEDNPKNIEFKEVEAAQIPNVLPDVDYAVINTNYALEAKLSPAKDALALEGADSPYVNVLVVKEGNEKTDKIKALAAALESQKVVDFINGKYQNEVVPTVANPTDGFDDSVNYDSLKGQTITVAATPVPHAEILAVVKEILAEKEITLDVKEFTDYVQPNNVVESGEIDANYFQHTPYLNNFNEENKTHLVVVASIHVEPIGLYGGKQTSLDALKS